MRFQETILERLGKALHVGMDDITHEPLPRGWVELILFLEEKERTRTTPGDSGTGHPGVGSAWLRPRDGAVTG